jgi:hypothetical protein
MQDLEGIAEDKDDENEDEELACNMDNDMDDDINKLDTLSREEQATFLETMAAVKEAIMKVRMLPFVHTLLPYMMLSGSKTVFCHHPFYHNHIASMASYLQGPLPQAQFNPMRCCYMMELYL